MLFFLLKHHLVLVNKEFVWKDPRNHTPAWKTKIWSKIKAPNIKSHFLVKGTPTFPQGHNHGLKLKGSYAYP